MNTNNQPALLPKNNPLRITSESSDQEVAYYIGQMLTSKTKIGNIFRSTLEQAYDRLNTRPSRPVRGADVKNLIGKALGYLFIPGTNKSLNRKNVLAATEMLECAYAHLEASQPVQSEGLREALQECQQVLASLTDDAAIKATTVINAYAQVKAAECKARAALAQGPAPVSRSAEEAAREIAQECLTNDEDYGNALLVDKAAAIIQQAIEQAKLEGMSYEHALSERPAADDKPNKGENEMYITGEGWSEYDGNQGMWFVMRQGETDPNAVKWFNTKKGAQNQCDKLNALHHVAQPASG